MRRWRAGGAQLSLPKVVLATSAPAPRRRRLPPAPPLAPRRISLQQIGWRAWRGGPEGELDRLAQVRGTPAYDRAAQRFTTKHLPLAYRYAGRFAREGRPLDDLRQVAALGLTEAVHKWEPDRAGQWALYAWYRCRYHLSRWVCQKEPMIHLPGYVMTDRRRVMRALEENAELDAAQLAQVTGLSLARVEGALAVRDGLSFEPLPEERT